MTPLRHRGPEAVADAWNAHVGDKYRIDLALVRQNLLDHPLFHDEASSWEGDAFVAIKRSAAGLYDGPDPKVAHLSLFGGLALDTRPFRAAVEILRDEGYDALVVGQDSGHFLPGAPTDVPSVLALRSMGFERGGLAFDLERDVSTLETGLLSSHGGLLGTLRETEIAALDEFLLEAFPGRWRYDVMRKVEAEGPRTVLVLVQDARVNGFALLQEEGCRLPIGGAVWRADLGDRWASLGPIGVAPDVRGAGLGSELLRAALRELRDRGARRTIIDWTGLLDFYGAQGFSVNRAYRTYRLSLKGNPPLSA